MATDPTATDALLRGWSSAQAAARGLPFYEDVVLGNLGRAAPRAALVALPGEDPAHVLWSGEAFEAWLGRPPQGVAVAALGEGLGHSLGAILRDALAGGQPVRARCNQVSGGMVLSTEILGLPLRDRTGGRYVLLCLLGETSRTNLLKAILRATGQGILALSAVRDEAGGVVDFQVVALNEAAAAMIGGPAAALMWRRLSAILPGPVAEATTGRLRPIAGASGRLSFEAAYRRADGAVLHLKIEAASLGDHLGLTLTDIGDVKAREESARLLFETNPLPMWVTDEAGRFLAVNDAAIGHYGYASPDFLRMSLRDLAVAGGAGSGEAPARHRRRDGSVIEVAAYSRRIPFEGRSATLTALVDVTERRRAEARITHMAHHDALTDLPNRVLFRQRIVAALEAQARDGRSAGLLCLDLDRFKLVNDTLGHPAGDELLRQAAQRLASCAQDGSVARLGGDEFALLAPADGPEAVMATARRVIAALAQQPFLVAGQAVQVGASVGVALLPADGTDPDVLLRRADMALYAAKAAGRGTAVAFEPAMDEAIQARRILEADLRAALEAGALEVHYQPLHDCRTLRILGCEALLRWRHPARGFVPPGEFVPLAEDLGLIGELGAFVLRAACREAAGWSVPLRVAVNLSPAQFRSPGLALSVTAILAETGLDPRRLDLEITETVLLSEDAANVAILSELRALGVRIAIDDFGTGYASLSYLRAFPFDQIKIDRSFVGRLGEDPQSAAIVRAVTNLGRSLGIVTVGEGVETPRQLEQLRAFGCDVVQGYLLGRPVPAAALRPLLAA
ncbi:putative bifunctional diguanylate cyclase/phosphodiesterase [Methylobacterium sp. WSM2598]|uniref:putative bifunctional diguanylate cyclase/phosphodiesterase n=1 Tax=Methylobacterium sp. WSM2598 TaxID=398261 RepID=UPI0003618D7D|nr:EAL domain-containing protein [Methylobacterium sp. WSM2598]